MYRHKRVNGDFLIEIHSEVPVHLTVLVSKACSDWPYSFPSSSRMCVTSNKWVVARELLGLKWMQVGPWVAKLSLKTTCLRRKIFCQDLNSDLGWSDFIPQGTSGIVLILFLCMCLVYGLEPRSCACYTVILPLNCTLSP